MAMPRVHDHEARRQRRGYVGCTNLGSGERAHGVGAPAIQRSGGGGGGRSRSDDGGAEKKKAARKKFALPLLQPASCTGSSHHRSEPHGCASSQHVSERENDEGDDGVQAAADDDGDGHVEKTLGEHIARVQRDAKSFKDEPWYRSPIGLGSSASVVHAALKQLDVRGSGFVRCHEIVEALQGRNFGLNERDVRALLATYDSALRDDSAVNYAAFATRIKFPPPLHDANGDDRVFRQQSYVEKIREHAHQLVVRSGQQQQAEYQAQVSSGHEVVKKTIQRPPAAHATTFVPVSPIAIAKERSRNHESSFGGNGAMTEMLAGSNNAFTALPTIEKPPPRLAGDYLVRFSGSGCGEDVDRLSFEFDKRRREIRASAKAGILLAHINRIEAFTRHEQAVNEQHENLRLAAKAMHRHEHYARLLQEEKHHIQMVEKQCKGLVKSDLTRVNRSVSKDSMFYVEPPLS